MRADPIVTGALVAAASCILVGVVRRIALRHGVLDVPTHRGSHTMPTPRGGGLGAIAAIIVACGAIAIVAGHERVLVCLAACAVVAAVGWTDDRRGLPVRTRLLAHVAAGATVGWLAVAGVQGVGIALALFAWWTFCTIASINLVNFMDGINGLVASQIAIFAASLALFGLPHGEATAYAIVVAAACLGFLPWNFPAARIFLGDVGSGALGFLVTTLAVLTMRESDIGIVRANLPLVPLLGDAVVTIFLRWRRGERLTEPHRTHLYQRMANGGVGHTVVTLFYAAVSAIGAFVAHVARGSDAILPIVLYVAAVVATGVALDSRWQRPTASGRIDAR